jgi:hypothetical protein
MRIRLSLAGGSLRRTLSIIGVGCVLLFSSHVDANPITINNFTDTTTTFFTAVTGSVGFFPDVHVLVDIPGTPWDSSSTIFESPGLPGPLVPDSVTVNWTIQNLLGPDPLEINPNPVGFARQTLAGAFVVARTQSGPGGQVLRRGELIHIHADLGSQVCRRQPVDSGNALP